MKYLIMYAIDGIPSEELRMMAKIQCCQLIDALRVAFAEIPPPKIVPHRLSAQRREHFPTAWMTQHRRQQEE